MAKKKKNENGGFNWTQKGKRGREAGNKEVAETLISLSQGQEKLECNEFVLNWGRMVVSMKNGKGEDGISYGIGTVRENYMGRNDTICCGVFDGHGPYGYLVAKKVRDFLMLKLQHLWAANLHVPTSSSTDDQGTAPLAVDENKKLSEMLPALKQSIFDALSMLDSLLKLDTEVDCSKSGTSAVVLIKQGQDLVVSNVGNSRAILGTRDTDNKLVPVMFTVDLMPKLASLKIEPEVAHERMPVAGSFSLAVSRTFGDFNKKGHGVIYVPEIYHHCLTERDEVLVIATEGVLGALSNEQIMDIADAEQTDGAVAGAIVERAITEWQRVHPNLKRPDCSVQFVYF